MLVRSRAPLRLGFAGGGTDVPPYSDLYGGAVLNATINMFAYAVLEPRNDGKIILDAVDRGDRYEAESTEQLELGEQLDLLKGVYNRIVKDFTHEPLSFTLSTYVDVPAGSGLGSSSTLVATIVGAFAEWLALPLGEYDIAHLAFEIERYDVKLTGGKQDQYAATFGGFNFMEFKPDHNVIVNPLRVKQEYIDELEFTLVLYYTGQSRLSTTILADQASRIDKKNDEALEATHQLKRQATILKEALLKGNLDKIGEILDFGWQNKRKLAQAIANPQINELYEIALKAGSSGGKISGAGGGGFFVFYCPGNSRYKVIEALNRFGGGVRRFQFAEQGLVTWKAPGDLCK